MTNYIWLKPLDRTVRLERYISFKKLNNLKRIDNTGLMPNMRL